MNFSEYQKRASAHFKEHENLKDEVCDWVIGLSEEAGEVASVVKHYYYGGERLKPEELAKEIGDVLWYLSALCTTLGIKFDTVAELNVAKLQHRYGDCFTIEGSRNRHENELDFKDTEEYKNIIKGMLLEKQGGMVYENKKEL